MASHDSRGRIVAVLGPTNTGKTHLAVERMLGHHSGMIGCPLRLLAREIYDRIREARGPGQVALITGEERILPERARYFVCTVESMPLDRQVEFLAVDEIQLAADPERGHVFTDRLLHARGLSETMFLGADTIAPLIRRLVPSAEVVTRPRFSRLIYAGAKKITRLPRRSAVVAFSASEVYALAELLRRLRGGAAVVMGALSPRTRNAQVALFQAGEVDYLVATDAIGMGLNMQVDHVAFAGLSKFDGHIPRSLKPAEIAQIAGRAGRHVRDGSFGTTADIATMDPAVIEAVVEHRFDPLTQLYWRNARLDFTSVRSLLHALEAEPPNRALIRPREVEDLSSLRALADSPEIAAMARDWESVSLLWEVCRIPDFRKTLADAHVRLLGQIYRYLMSPGGRLPSAWLARMLEQLDRGEGDIDTLAARIAHIRTWTYVSHRPGWVEDPVGLQERTRAIEDRLSDALHDRLTQRFVDRRSASLVRRLRQPTELLAAIRGDGSVLVEGEPIGQVEGLRFTPDDALAWREGKSLRSAAQRVLGPAIEKRAAAIAGAPDTAFTLDNGLVLWQSQPIARLGPGDSVLTPRVEPLSAEFVSGPMRARVGNRAQAWLKRHLSARFQPLSVAREAELGGAERGLLFQLREALGSVPRAGVRDQVAALDRDGRARLAKLGVRLGRRFVYVPALLKPDRIALRALLWSIAHGQTVTAPPPGRVSLPKDFGGGEAFLLAIGYASLGPVAVRIDLIERLANRLFKRAAAGPFVPDADLAASIGCRASDLPGLLAALGFRPVADAAAAGEGRLDLLYQAGQRLDSPAKAARRRPGRADTDSPFAALGRLKLTAQ